MRASSTDRTVDGNVDRRHRTLRAGTARARRTARRPARDRAPTPRGRTGCRRSVRSAGPSAASELRRRRRAARRGDRRQWPGRAAPDECAWRRPGAATSSSYSGRYVISTRVNGVSPFTKSLSESSASESIHCRFSSTSTKGRRRASAPMSRKFASNARCRRVATSRRQNAMPLLEGAELPEHRRGTYSASSGSTARIAAPTFSRMVWMVSPRRDRSSCG